MAILPPSPATLARYGLTLAEWQAHAQRTKGVCPICKKEPPTKRLVIDHEHVKGWGAMGPAQRKLYVRGLLCNYDNWKFLPRGSTPEKLRAAADYLEAYERRRPA